jgi:hypothetical protein
MQNGGREAQFHLFFSFVVKLQFELRDLAGALPLEPHLIVVALWALAALLEVPVLFSKSSF